MRSYISIILGFTLLALAACTRQIEEFDTVTSEGNRIVISATAAGVVTRSADTGPESTIAWVDAYVMDESYNIVYSERIDKSSAPVVGGGEFVLNQKREDFTAGKKYYIYLIANSTSPLSDAQTWSELKELTQKDEHLHLSGISGIEDLTVPTYFLMDGFAYVPSNATDNGPANLAAYVINDSQNTDDLVLKGTLKRAAAKLVLKITQGDNVQFMNGLEGSFPLYSYYQLPISTLVVTPDADADFESEKQNTKEWGVDNRNQSFNWSQDGENPVLNLVGYAYAHDWTDESDNGASLLINIPLMWDKDGASANGKEAPSPVNWYEIPLSQSQKFERNRCYVINVKINAIGAEEINTPIILEDIEYVTLDWQEVEVDLGTNEARYLTLNTDLVKIYDSNFDLDQLTFTSSSPIKSIKLKDVFSHNESVSGSAAFSALELTQESDGTTEAEYETGDGVYAYYIDKFGQKIQLGTDPGFDLKITDASYAHLTKEEILQLEKKLYQKEGVDVQHIHAEVPADQKRALNGDIYIYSPIYPIQDEDDLNWNSHFNTVRYLEFEVMNEQGLTATFRVEQYPLSVITNEEGFYSYRDDHVLTDDPNEHPFDLFHYDPEFKSFMTTSMYLVHPHDFTDEPRPSEEVWANTPEMHLVRPEDFKGEPDEEYWNTPQQNRDYSWTKKTSGTYTWLTLHTDNSCPTQGSAGETWIEIRYGFYDNVVNFVNVDNGKTGTKSLSGIHRPVKEDRPYTDYCYRNMYQHLHGEYDITHKSYKGTGLSAYYKAEVIDADGNKQTRIFRDHFRWNAQPVFWSKFVHKYYSQPGQGASYSGKSVYKLRGQVDMYEYGPSEDGDKTWGRYIYSTNLYKFSNHRMYRVNTTATSEDYTLGYPRQTEEGKTENTVYNSKLVSPTLMLASQLGETNYQQFLETAKSKGYIIPNIKEIYRVAERHCREYVETTFIDEPNELGEYNHMWDEGEEIIEYHDWRLPTKSEIEAIINFQNSSRAMDKVLDAQYYFCITGTADSDDLTNIHNWVSREIPNYDSATSKGYYIRCVRDASK